MNTTDEPDEIAHHLEMAWQWSRRAYTRLCEIDGTGNLLRQARISAGHADRDARAAMTAYANWREEQA